MSYDPPELLAAFAREHGIGYPLLSDPESRTIDAYGVRNLEASGRTACIPHPGFFLLSSGSVVRAKLFRSGYKERPGLRELLEAARAAVSALGRRIRPLTTKPPS